MVTTVFFHHKKGAGAEQKNERKGILRDIDQDFLEVSAICGLTGYKSQ
jgi:sigma54-dependent transcription regulator